MANLDIFSRLLSKRIPGPLKRLGLGAITPSPELTWESLTISLLFIKVITTHLVLGGCQHNSRLPFVLRRHLLRPELVVQLVDRPGEPEWDLVSELIYGRSCIDSDVERLVNGHEQRNCVRNRLLRHLLAIHREHAGATLSRARSIIFEVKHDGVLSFAEPAE